MISTCGLQLCETTVYPEMSAEIAAFVERVKLTTERLQDPVIDVVESAQLFLGKDSTRPLDKMADMLDVLDAEDGASGSDEASQIEQQSRGCAKTLPGRRLEDNKEAF